MIDFHFRPRGKVKDRVLKVSTMDSDCTNRELGRHHPKKHCWLNTRYAVRVAEVGELCQVLLSSHGKAGGFPRLGGDIREVAQEVEQMCRVPLVADLEEVQKVAGTLLTSCVMEEDLEEGRTDLSQMSIGFCLFSGECLRTG